MSASKPENEPSPSGTLAEPEAELMAALHAAVGPKAKSPPLAVPIANPANIVPSTPNLHLPPPPPPAPPVPLAPPQAVPVKTPAAANAAANASGPAGSGTHPVKKETEPDLAEPYHPVRRPPLAMLTVFDDGKTEGENVRLRKSPFYIGRTLGDLTIPFDEGIIDHHVEIGLVKQGSVYRWGINVRDGAPAAFLRVRRTQLKDGDELLIGTGRYRFDLPAELSTGSIGYGMSATVVTPGLTELIEGQAEQRFPLVKEEYWIGSSPECEFPRADDPFASRKHALIYRDNDGTWHAENNKTYNGMWVRFHQFSTKSECVFQIGEQRFRLTVSS